jgi:hypothetical protein
MAYQNILKMVQNAEMELGLPVSASVFGQNGLTDPTGTQLGALANRVLDELRRCNRWTAMQFEYDLVVNPVVDTTGNMQAQSPVITNIPSTAGLAAWTYACQGPGVPAAARILSVDSPTQITMTMENTNTAVLTNQSIQFAQDTYPMPVGFDWFNNRTMWDRTNRWELLGPDSPQMDQWHRSGIVVTGPRRHFRQLGPGVGTYADQFRLWPAPYELTPPLQLVFEYLSTAAVNQQGAGTTFQQYFTNDADTPLLDDQAIIIGMKWMFWEVKGFGSYTTMQSRWVDYVERLAARDGGAPTLQVAKRQNPIFISPANVQDGFYPGPVGPNSS